MLKNLLIKLLYSKIKDRYTITHSTVPDYYLVTLTDTIQEEDILHLAIDSNRIDDKNDKQIKELIYSAKLFALSYHNSVKNDFILDSDKDDEPINHSIDSGVVENNINSINTIIYELKSNTNHIPSAVKMITTLDILVTDLSKEFSKLN